MSNLSEIKDVHQITLIDFNATWCGPCQTLAPILDDVQAHFGDALTILKIDVDQHKNMAQKFQIRSVPTLLLFKNDKMLWRQAGLVSKKDLIHVISTYN